MLSLAVPRPIIQCVSGATGEERDLASSLSLLSGCNKIKKDAVFCSHKLTLQGGGRRGGDKRQKMGADTLRVDGGKMSGGWRRTWEETAGDGSGRQRAAAYGGGQRRTAADNGGRRQFVDGAAVVWMMAVGSGVNNVWLIVSKRFFLPGGIARTRLTPIVRRVLF